MKDAAINGCDQIVSKAGEHAYQIRENKIRHQQSDSRCQFHKAEKES